MTAPAPTPAAAKPGMSRKTLTAVIGSAMGAAAAFVLVPAEESGRTVEAKVEPDQTITLRHVTTGVTIGKTYAPAQCDAMLEAALIAHAEPIMRCAPGLYGRGNQAAAVVSLAYNMGTGAICASTLVRRINAGDWAGAAASFAAWNKVTVPAKEVAAYRRRGETCAPKAADRWSCTVKGLTDRRERERRLFVQGLPL
jgi:lysozyme